MDSRTHQPLTTPATKPEPNSAQSFHNPHRRSGRQTTQHHHLQPALHAYPATPLAHKQRLAIPKHEQRDRHDQHTKRQRSLDIASEEIWQQRYEPAEEIATCDCEGGDVGTARARLVFREAVMESHEEVDRE